MRLEKRIGVILTLLVTALASADPAAAEVSQSSLLVEDSPVITTKAPGGDSAVQVNGSPVVTVATQRSNVPTDRLLLPFYSVVHNVDPSLRTTTLFAVVNESNEAVNVRYSYFEASTPQSYAYQETLWLDPKAFRWVDMHEVFNACSGCSETVKASGFVIIETVDEAPVLHGDYWRIDQPNATASGYRLVDIGNSSAGNALCKRFSVRFTGSALTGTLLTLWVAREEVAPEGQALASWAAFDQAGTFQDSGVVTNNKVAFEQWVGAAPLDPPVANGSVEIDFLGHAGHVSSTVFSFGLFSIGSEATCLEP